MGKKRTQTIVEIKSEGQLCTACNKKKDVSEFYPSYQYTGGRKCKPCVKEYSRKHHKKSYENRKQHFKTYYQKNKERAKKYQIKYRKENWEKIKEYRRTPEVHLARQQRKYISSRIKKSGGVKQQSSGKYLGCTTEELMVHLEKQFQPGMSWDNHGYDGWHVDHIRPCASFDLTDEEQVRKCFHYTNLQPLWAKDNLRKGSEWNG